MRCRLLFNPQWTNISHSQEGGGTNTFHAQEGKNIFTLRGGQTFLHRGEGQTFFVGAYDDVDEEMVVSEANFL